MAPLRGIYARCSCSGRKVLICPVAKCACSIINGLELATLRWLNRHQKERFQGGSDKKISLRHQTLWTLFIAKLTYNWYISICYINLYQKVSERWTMNIEEKVYIQIYKNLFNTFRRKHNWSDIEKLCENVKNRRTSFVCIIVSYHYVLK